MSFTSPRRFRASSRSRFWIRQSRSLVDIDDRLEPPQAQRRAASCGRDLRMVEIGVAAMQQPAVSGPHGDAAMAAGVAGEGDQQNVLAGAWQRPHAGEAEPVLAVRFDRRPFRHAGELRGAVSIAFHQRRRVHRCSELGREHMHARAGKVGKAARVIEVEMGRHDVTDVGDAETQIRDLAKRRLRDLEPRARRDAEHNPSRLGSATSSTPIPVSTRMSPSSLSISRQWQHIGAGAHGPPAPPNRRPPRGHNDPQLR